jgi:hypothetical protein
MFWVHLGQFRYYTKLGEERAELVQLMQKFMPWSRIRIFGKERTRSSPLDPKLMFWCVLYHFGASGTILLHQKSRYRTAELVQLMQTFVPWSRIVIFPNQRSHSHQSTLNSYIGAFCTVWLHLWPFRYGTIVYAKWAEILQLVQKYVPRSRVGIFRNDCSQATAIDPNLMFWCVSYHLAAFGTVSLLHETRCKMGRTVAINAKVRVTKSRLKFSQRAHPVHTIGP